MRWRLLAATAATLAISLGGCGTTQTPPASKPNPPTTRAASSVTTSASPATNGSPRVTDKPGLLPPGVDRTSLVSVATAYARAADPWQTTSFAAQAAFWTSECLAKRGAHARRIWASGVSIIPHEREIYARAHIPQPLPSVPETADILDGSGGRGVAIADVTPADRVVTVFFADPRTGTSKTSMLSWENFSFIGGAWRYDGC